MLLFVYGSLKRGEFNHDRYAFNEIAEYKGPAVAEGVQILQVADYPFPHARAYEDSLAEGELYELDLNNLECLMLFQKISAMEAGAGYDQAVMQVVDEEGKKHTAIVFVATGWKLKGLLRLGYKVVLSWTGKEAEEKAA